MFKVDNIIKNNYREIIDHYESMVIADKLTEQPNHYVINAINPYDWTILLKKDKYDYYFHKHNHDFEIIFNLSVIINPSKILTLPNVNLSLKNELQNIPLNLHIQDIIFNIQENCFDFGVVLQMRLVLSLDEYYINLKNLKLFEEKVFVITAVFDELFHKIIKET